MNGPSGGAIFAGVLPCRLTNLTTRLSRLCRRLAFGFAMALALAGCQWKGEPTSPAGDGPTASEEPASDQPAAWYPRPSDINIYPATQFVERDGEPMLEAAIELLDELGDAVKGPGQLRLALFARGQYGQVGEQLYRWDVSLRTKAQQQKYFDLVTRTYVLRLSLDDQQVTTKPTLLRVTFVQPDGPRLQTERSLPIEW